MAATLRLSAARVVNVIGIAGADFTLANDRDVKPGPAAEQKSSDHVLAVEPDPQLEARLPRLRDEEFGGARPEPVADADVGFEQTFGRQVFAEHAPRQVKTRQFFPPVA